MAQAVIIKRGERKLWTPQTYIEDAPIYLKVGYKTYECKDIIERYEDLICIQYDGVAILVEKPRQSER